VLDEQIFLDSSNQADQFGGVVFHDEAGRGFPFDPIMKLITALIRPERLREVKEALFRVGVTGMTLSRVSGHGGEREIVEHYRGSALVLEFREKVKIEAAVSEPFVEPTIRAIISAARTGEVGDGKIFVQELERVIRIRTGEADVAALTPVTADMVQARARHAQIEEPV
jgi:nitrogen regulatory protein P-II 1